MPLEEAVRRILDAMPPPAIEIAPLQDCVGRVVLQPLLASVDLPRFDNSSMDGYAVRSGDVQHASPDQPVSLRLAASLPAGFSKPPPTLAPGECARVFTGSPLPAGTDAVVMQEDTLPIGGTIQVRDRVRPWENIRLRGEDIRLGTVLCKPGVRLTPGLLALSQATGLATGGVGRRPRVGILATGNELTEPGQALAPGGIYESNRALLKVLSSRAGAIVSAFPLVADDLQSTSTALAEAARSCDLILTIGGASVGDHDYVKQAILEQQGAIDFWKLALKPGKPFLFANLHGTPLFGLPGNPVSAVVTFALLVRPAILKWQGAADVDLPGRPGTLLESLHNPGPRRHFVRVVQETGGGVRSSGRQASHMMASLADSNGLVNVPPDTTLPSGSPVEVLLWDA